MAFFISKQSCKVIMTRTNSSVDTLPGLALSLTSQVIFRMQLTLCGPDFSMKGGCEIKLMCTNLLQLNVNVILEHKLAKCRKEVSIVLSR